ncbi:DUF6612 family protein [Phosphitispora sp. TUW77]|uniref:DUF6612 family protein n=1 Tax=Phosphitispora sp. TUW77 TaxID=3152361 RepID=UPI003AB656FF
MKKAVQVFICLIFILTAFSSMASAAEPVKVLIDDEVITFDVNPVIREGRTLVPVRKIIESMGGEVIWNADNRTVIINKGDDNVVLIIDSNLAKVNEKDVIMDVPAAIIDGRTLIPLRFVSENLDAVVSWDAATRTVSIKTPVNIDEEAYALLVASMEKNKDLKQYNVDIEGEMEIAGTGLAETGNITVGIVGNMKIDAEAPAYAFNGNLIFTQGTQSLEMDYEFVFKDYVLYIKDPLTGTWTIQEMSEEEAAAFAELIEQSNSLAIDYTAFLDAVRESGAFRSITFAGEQTINGKQTTGVTLEINGVKLAKILEMIFTDYYGETLSEAEMYDELFTDLSAEIQQVLTVSKLNYTYWIGNKDDIYYGCDYEMIMGIDMGPEQGNVNMKGDFSMTLSDINQTQVITVPEITETAADVISD